MSDTPRTDAEQARVMEASQGYLPKTVSADFARELERDLAAMQKARDGEKVAHARSTKYLREELAKARGTERVPGWEDAVLHAAGEL